MDSNLGLKLFLPPNLELCAPRDAIPAKLEIAPSTGAPLPPETLPEEALGQLGERERLAAYALLQWSGGAMSSFFQLDRQQLSQLIQTLEGTSVFRWVNDPRKPIAWRGAELIGVSHLLTTAEENPPSEERAPIKNAASNSEFEYAGPGMTVDGSTHFLSIGLPSREHPRYLEIREILDGYGFKLEPRNRKWWLRDRHRTLNFLSENWDALKTVYGADFSESFISRTKNIRDAELIVDAREDDSGYTVTFALSTPGVDERELNRCLASAKNYVEKDGRVYLLAKDKLDSARALHQSLALSPKAPLLQRGSFRLPYSRVAELEDELLEANPNFKPPETWNARSRALRDLESLPEPKLGPPLDEMLRPYQKVGVAWMQHLFANGLGGILADEMGLGKTIQALALISSLKSATGPPEGGAFQRSRPGLALVVCPASLVENWRREAALRTPGLRVFINHGDQRIESPDDLRETDLIITSYSTLIRDLPRIKTLPFNCIVADEAQHIKNRRTRNAKAITELKARGRFLLTGTPIENSIQDLVSLLEFILPGNPHRMPSDLRGEERAWREKRILKYAAPYILRRRKHEVAPELPQKIEQTIFVKMGPEQQALYEKTRLIAQTELADLERSGASEGSVRMKALTQLLRLRQLCCDPRLLDENEDPGRSCKRSSFRELLEEALDGGHRILVFSQFVRLLRLLEGELSEERIETCYLDGSTKNRMAEVDRFQNSRDIPVFLISLKAGGVGLNLTAADTVIHFDPWWNPAAESQATDRAHRIGQEKVVTSYRMIVADSVEERVLRMQQAKRRLLEDIFEASDAANAKIRLGDLKELLQ